MQGRSEVACGFEERAVDGIYLAETTADLNAGQVVAVVVKGTPWFRATAQRE